MTELTEKQIDAIYDRLPKQGLEQEPYYSRTAIRLIGNAAITTIEEERVGLVEALTPSAETKAAYMGEFSFTLPETDENGDEYQRKFLVPWTTIKEIMAAIRSRAALVLHDGR